MKSVHREQDIKDVCEALVRERGLPALKREPVQEELRRRAELAGHGPVGADHETVGRIIREVRAESLRARSAAREAAVAEAASGEVPQRVTEVVARFSETLGETIRGVVVELQRRAEAEAQARVMAAESAASARVAELLGEIEALRTESEALVSDIEETSRALDERSREVAELSTALAEHVTGAQVRDADTQRRTAALEADVRAANGARTEAEARAYAAERTQSRLEASVARLEERLNAEQRARDEWYRWAQRLEERASAAEVTVEALRNRLKVSAAEDKGARDQDASAVASPTNGGAPPRAGAGAPQGRRRRQRA